MTHQTSADQSDRDLDHVRAIRLRMIDDLCKDKIPGDKEDRAFLLSLLDGMDRSAMGRKRIKTDEKVGSNVAHAMSLISEIYKQSDVRTLGQSDRPRAALPVLEDGVEVFVVDGELETNPVTEDFDSFMARTSQLNQGA